MALRPLGWISLAISLPLISAVVIPPSLRPKFNSTAGKRAENLDYNIRLLAVLGLQQNVRDYFNPPTDVSKLK